MRILEFRKNIQKFRINSLLPNKVVIDGQNYFYNLYRKSGLPYAFGCESDKYAQFLKDHLRMFIKAEVTCFVVFKGGHENPDNIRPNERNTGQDFDLERDIEKLINNETVLPVFMKDVYKEVLRELGIGYVVCQFESKRQCIALAQELDCPIISNDIEFCFSGVPYIPDSTLCYDDIAGNIKCQSFNFQAFKNHFKLSDKEIAIFIALTNEHGFNPNSTFHELFHKRLVLPARAEQRNDFLLKWLYRSKSTALNVIYNCMNMEERWQFDEELKRVESFICKKETPDIPANYLLNGNTIHIIENDSEWFEKGVALGHVAIIYINLYRSDMIFGSWCIEDIEADDAMLLSFDIIAYAYSLMTNCSRETIKFFNNNGQLEERAVNVAHEDIIKNVAVSVQTSIFENGWDRVSEMRLFEKFLLYSLPGVELAAFDTVPEDARLLCIALVYFSRHKRRKTLKEVYSILLSYVILGVVSVKLKDENEAMQNTDRYVNLVNFADCSRAMDKMNEFFTLSFGEQCRIFDRQLLHSFVEFQHCLQHMNYLNILCGRSYMPTLYSKTYNGSFAFKFFYTIRNLSDYGARAYIDDLLSDAPSVKRVMFSLIKHHASLV